MVERIARDFTDVVDGRKSWKDLLHTFVEQAGGTGVSSTGSEGGRQRKRGRD